jgi:hypothetical protein
MKLLLRDRVIGMRRRGGPQEGGRRALANLSPVCEALDDRHLLSAMAPALAVPPATAVAAAAATLNDLNPAAFAQFQGDRIDFQYQPGHRLCRSRSRRSVL